MDLSRLTIKELSTLEEALRLIRRGAEILAGLSKDSDLIVQMIPGKPATIITGWTFPQAGQGEQIEPVAVVPAAVFVPDAAELVAKMAPWSEDAPAIAPTPVAVETPAQPIITDELSTVLTGPLTEAERRQIIAAIEAGQSRREIAMNMNRRLQTVALFATAWEKNRPAPTTKENDRVVVPSSSPRLDNPVMTGGPDASDAPDTGQAPAAASVPTADAAPIPAPVQQAAPSPITPDDDRPSRQRQIGRMLNVVRPRRGFDPELDLEVAEAIMRGDKLPQIALDLGVDGNDLKFRWSDLTSRLRDDRGQLSIDDQKFLLLELRRKVREARGAAA